MVDHMCSKHVRHNMIDIVRNRYYAFKKPNKMNPLKRTIYHSKSVIRILCCYSDLSAAIFQATDITAK